MSTERPTPETDRTHNHCSICDWLEREALRTMREEGTDQWTSTTDEGRTTHTVRVWAGDA